MITTNLTASSHLKTLDKEATPKKLLAGLSLISGESLSQINKQKRSASVIVNFESGQEKDTFKDMVKKGGLLDGASNKVHPQPAKDAADRQPETAEDPKQPSSGFAVYNFPKKDQ